MSLAVGESGEEPVEVAETVSQVISVPSKTNEDKFTTDLSWHAAKAREAMKIGQAARVKARAITALTLNDLL